MRKERAIDLLADMLKIYTPSLQEAPLAEYIAERMSGDLGFKNVRIGEANNVTGEVGSGSPTILLSGHMDTVPGNQPVKVTEDAVHGRGACDAKSSLAAMLVAASDLSTRSDIGKVIVAAVSDEEGNGLGTRALLDSGIDADYAIFGEPSGTDNVTIGYKGRLGFTLTCGAPSLHASAPWMSQNAIESIYEVWRAVKSYAAERTGKNQYTSVTASLTEIHGGSSHNTTPEKCRVTIDMRIPPHLSASKTAEDVEKIVGRFQSDTVFPKIELKMEDITEPFETDKTSELVRAIVRAILQVRRKRPLLLRKTGTGDMNLLGHRLGIPVVTYGPGNPHLSHTRREFVEISEYLSSIEVYKATVANIVKQHSTS
ncbi:MAG: M20/M25/M40 family metallo-hydrolase [Nitrososphaerales archaeon]